MRRRSEVSTEIVTFTTADEVSSYAAHHESSGIDFFVLSYSQADWSGYAREALESKKSVMYHASRLIVQYKAQLMGSDVLRYFATAPAGSPGSQVDSAFVQDVGALPTSLSGDANSVAVKSFIDKYGTHYLEDAFFGGQLSMDVVVSQDYITRKGSHYAGSQVAFGFDLVLVSFGMNSAYNSSAGGLDADFVASSTCIIRGFGGDPSLINKKSFDQWAASVHLQPSPVNSTFRPLQALFTDSKKSEMFTSAVAQFTKVAPKVKSYCAEPPGKTVPLDSLHPGVVSMSWDEVQERARKMMAAKGSAQAAKRPAAPAPRALDGDAPVLPAVDSGIGRGFDGKAGVVKLPVTDLGYAEGKTWYDPIAAKTWKIPDGLSFESIPCGCIREQSISLRNDTNVWRSLTESSGFNIGLSIPIPDTPVAVSLGVSFEQAVAHARGVTKNWSLAMDYLTRESVSYEVQFGASSNKLSPMFQRMIDALPATQGPAYTQLIQYWGTHVITGSKFGGACNVTSTWNQSLLLTKSEDYVSHQVGISIGLKMISSGIGVDIGFGFGGATKNSKVDSAFAANSKTDMHCVGGDVEQWQNGEWDKWVESIRNAPALIPGSTQLRPIHEFVTDTTRRTLLREAIMDYLDIKA